MKKFAILVVALAALLVLPSSAKADSITYTGASGSVSGLGAPWSGSGSFAANSLGTGIQSFSFSTFFNLGGALSSITIGSGVSSFTGIFDGGFSSGGSCGVLCTVWTADLIGVGGSAGELGSITLDLTFNGFGQWVITGGTADPGVSNTPEPGTLGMFAVGLIGLGLMFGRKLKTAQLPA
jgi:PEP-CTERM motif